MKKNGGTLNFIYYFIEMKMINQYNWENNSLILELGPGPGEVLHVAEDGDPAVQVHVQLLTLVAVLPAATLAGDPGAPGEADCQVEGAGTVAQTVAPGSSAAVPLLAV